MLRREESLGYRWNGGRGLLRRQISVCQAVLAVICGPVGMLALELAMVVVRPVFDMVMGLGAILVMVAVLGDTVLVLAEDAMQAHVQRRHELEPTQPEEASEQGRPLKSWLLRRSSAHGPRRYLVSALPATPASCGGGGCRMHSSWRLTPLRPGRWLLFLVVCVCLRFSAFYQLMFAPQNREEVRATSAYCHASRKRRCISRASSARPCIRKALSKP